MKQLVFVEFLLVVVIYFAIGYFRFFTEQKRLDKEHKYLHLNSGFFLVGFLGTVISIVLAILAVIFKLYAFGVLLLAFGIVFSFVLSGYYGYRIYFDDEKIVYRKYFESYKAIYYKDVTKIVFEYDLEIKTKKKKLTVPCYMANFNLLLESVKGNCPEKAMKKVDPKVKVRKFSDSVNRPGEFIFAFVLMYLLDVCLIVFLIPGFLNGEIFSSGLSVAMIFIVAIVGCFSFPIVTVISVKRAHSSKFWRKVARVCVREWYLKDYKRDDDSIC